MRGEIPLLESRSLGEFFKERVSDSIHTLKVEASPEAEFYLVQLLTTFTEASRLYESTEGGQAGEKPLALRYFEATLASRHEKIPVLKKMGDVALYTSGFFADSFFKKVISADYYIHMGETAYSSLSHILSSEKNIHVQELFEELADKFIRFVDVLSDVAHRSRLGSDTSLLKLYERWLKTGSKKAYDLLVEQGMVPNSLVKTGYTQ